MRQKLYELTERHPWFCTIYLFGIVFLAMGLLMFSHSRMLLAEDSIPSKEPIIEDLAEPQEAMSGLYDFRVNVNGILIVNVDSHFQLTQDKFKRLEFAGPRSPDKNWRDLQGWSEKMFREIMAIDGIVDFSTVAYQFAVQISERSCWIKTICQDEKWAMIGKNSRLQVVLEIIDKYVTL